MRYEACGWDRHGVRHKLVSDDLAELMQRAGRVIGAYNVFDAEFRKPYAAIEVHRYAAVKDWRDADEVALNPGWY